MLSPVATCPPKKFVGKNAWEVRSGPLPSWSGQYLYCFNTDGTAYVVDVGAKGKIAAQNELGEAIWGSPAVANNAIYVRSHDHLWKIAESGHPPSGS